MYLHLKLFSPFIALPQAALKATSASFMSLLVI